MIPFAALLFPPTSLKCEEGKMDKKQEQADQKELKNSIINKKPL